MSALMKNIYHRLVDVLNTASMTINDTGDPFSISALLINQKTAPLEQNFHITETRTATKLKILSEGSN